LDISQIAAGFVAPLRLRSVVGKLDAAYFSAAGRLHGKVSGITLKIWLDPYFVYRSARLSGEDGKNVENGALKIYVVEATYCVLSNNCVFTLL